MAGRIVIVTGPPGAGKTTLARKLAEASENSRAVHLHTDDFYTAIRRGYAPPWLKHAQVQNATVTNAIAAAAAAYAAGGYDVIVEGIVGPWFLGPYRERAAAEGAPLHYVFLRVAKALAVQRAAERADRPISAYPPKLYEQLSALGDYAQCAIDIDAFSPAQTLDRVREGLAAGRFRIRL